MLRKLLLVLVLCSSLFATVTADEAIREFFDGDGETTEFTFTIPCYASTEISVYKQLISTGVPETLVEDDDYTITYTGSSYLEGGVVTIDPALASTYQVVVERKITNTQETVPAAINSTSIVAGFDKLQRTTQDLWDRNNRGIRLDPTAEDANLTIPVLRKSTILGFDDSNDLVVYDLTDIGDVNITGTINLTGGSVSMSGGTAIVDSNSNITVNGGTVNVIDVNVIDVNFYANVQDYGAVGDDSTDDTDSIQAAIDSLTSGGTLYFPIGTYKITEPLISTIAIHILGDGTNGVDASICTVIKNYGDDDAIWLKAKGSNIVENLDIVDGLGDGVRTAGSGIRSDRDANGSTVSIIRNVRVDGHYNGIVLKVPNLSTIQNCVIRNCDNHGIWLQGRPNYAAGTSVSLINNFVDGCGGNGYMHDGQGYCHYSNCATDDCTNGYVLVNDSGYNPSGITFTACGAERHSNAGLLLTNGDSVSGITVVGGKFATSVDGLQLNNADDVTLVGVTTASNTGYGINDDNVVAGRVLSINHRSSSDYLGPIKAGTSSVITQLNGSDLRVPSAGIIGMLGTGGRIQFTAGSIVFLDSSSSNGFGAFRATGNNFDVRNDLANGQALTMKAATTTKTAMSGATVTATNLIPAGSMVIGITVRVTTLITGATTFDIGDGTDVDRWGAAIALAAGTTTTIANFTQDTDNGPIYFPSATSVVLTANGSNFTAGAVRITVHYIDLTAPTS